VNQNKDRRRKHQNLAITVIMLVLFLSDIVGEKGQVFLDFAAFIGLIVLGVIILYLFIKGNLSDALKSLAMTVPLVVMAWGFYINNITIAFSGIGLFFVIGLLKIILDKLNV